MTLVADDAVYHVKIMPNPNGSYGVTANSPAFDSIHELVAHFQAHSLETYIPSVATKLSFPFRLSHKYDAILLGFVCLFSLFSL